MLFIYTAYGRCCLFLEADFSLRGNHQHEFSPRRERVAVQIFFTYQLKAVVLQLFGGYIIVEYLLFGELLRLITAALRAYHYFFLFLGLCLRF